MALILIMISYRITAIALISSTAPVFLQPPAFFIRWGSGAVAEKPGGCIPFPNICGKVIQPPGFSVGLPRCVEKAGGCTTLSEDLWKGDTATRFFTGTLILVCRRC